jgi:hypothetical protein
MALSEIAIVRNTGYNQTLNLATMPSCPEPRSVTFTANDTTATSRSVLTGITQTQIWPGADYWDIQVNLPPMKRNEAAAWIAFLMSLQGQANVFQIGDPDGKVPLGVAATGQIGAPQVNTSSPSTMNLPGTTTLSTMGWAASQFRLILPGTYLQIGYRLYVCLDVVDSDVDGNATFSIWPSLREQPANGTAIQLKNTTGLFRLASNARQWSNDVAQLYGISFKATEAI